MATQPAISRHCFTTCRHTELKIGLDDKHIQFLLESWSVEKTSDWFSKLKLQDNHSLCVLVMIFYSPRSRLWVIICSLINCICYSSDALFASYEATSFYYRQHMIFLKTTCKNGPSYIEMISYIENSVAPYRDRVKIIQGLCKSECPSVAGGQSWYHDPSICSVVWDSWKNTPTHRPMKSSYQLEKKILTHLKLWIAIAIHNFKWVKLEFVDVLFKFRHIWAAIKMI